MAYTSGPNADYLAVDARSFSIAAMTCRHMRAPSMFPDSSSSATMSRANGIDRAAWRRCHGEGARDGRGDAPQRRCREAKDQRAVALLLHVGEAPQRTAT
jgi:hypothetical protein